MAKADKDAKKGIGGLIQSGLVVFLAILAILALKPSAEPCRIEQRGNDSWDRYDTEHVLTLRVIS